MSGTAADLVIDTDAARRAGTAWIEQGDGYYRTLTTLRTDLEHLHLHRAGFAATRSLGAAAEAAWSAGTLLRLVCDAVEMVDGFRVDDPSAIATLARIADGVPGDRGFGTMLDRLLGASPMAGDLGGTHSAELRSPYSVFGADPAERGRNLIVRALSDTANEAQIRADEFEVVQLAHDRFIVVLPGVTDLSRPDLFLSGRHRSVRDLDQAAWSSAWSSDIDDNPYAQLVHDGLDAAGVPSGSELLLVGHSFGADTAIDLAADPTFNGDEYRVTHVVAAGYHVDEYLADVPGGTDVLVLENARDAAVIAEAVGHSAAAEAVGSGAGMFADLVTGDLAGAAGRFADSVTAQVEAVGDFAGYVVDRRDDLGELVAGLGSADWQRVSAAAQGLVTLEPGVTEVSNHVIVDVFDGGADGAGHHPSNYLEHIATTGDARVVDFLAGLDAAGYAASGSAVAIDLSVPR